MKIRTFEELQEKIDEELAWRKKELIDIKTLIEDKNNNFDKSILIRAGIALLSAHWEGFIRIVANYYVIYICHLNIKNYDLKSNFYALFLKKEILNSSKTEKNSIHTNLINAIDSKKNDKFFIKYTEENRIIKTDSNLTYELFEEILKSIDIKNIYELKKNYIEGNLLKVRHEIVHGEKTKLDPEDFTITFEQVFEIIENFKKQVYDAAENRLFLKEKTS